MLVQQHHQRTHASYAAIVVVAFMAAIGKCDTTESVPKVDFKSDIRPILSNRCFACHGPDENKIESGLRLDHFESATQPADSGETAIVPGNPQTSELIRRIRSHDDTYRMPPPQFGAPLTEKEASLLEAWIASGAKYSKHWSFDRLAKTTPVQPSLAERFPKWQHSSIDSFVLSKLEQRGWEPSPEADRSTLLRRVTLDLTGLPPTIEQQASFAADPSDLAYERLVDELLASPAFGEHWGRKWLDLARYADSAGYADDPQRTIWAYRDWVIRAINEGKSFDAFTIEQLAGDLLPNPSDEQLVATAFHRNTLTNNEGGTNDEEFRNVAVVDRVNTTMAVWMGLTMACAQCHSHKFDPISQKEYFQVFAILNQTQDADRGDESPILQWFSPEQRQYRHDTQLQLERVIASLEAPAPELMKEQQAWADNLRKPLEFQPLVPKSATAQSTSAITIQPTGQVKVEANSDNDAYTLELPLPTDLDLSKITAIQLNTIPDASLPNQGAAIGNGNFVLTHVSASLSPQQNTSVHGRFVRIEQPGPNKILSLAEVQVLSNDTNLTQGAKATQSSTDFGGPAERAIDGNTSGIYADNSTTHSAISESPWWEVDLGKVANIDKLVIWNRTDPGTEARLVGAKVSILSVDRQPLWTGIIEQPKASQPFDIQSITSMPLTLAASDYAQDGFPAAHAVDGDAKTGWAVGGSIDKPHQLTLALASAEWKKRIAAQVQTGPSVLRLTLKFESVHLRAVLASFSVGLSMDTRAETLVGLPHAISKLVALDSSTLSADDAAALHRYYVSTVSPSRQALRDSRAALSKRLADIQPTSTVPVLRELAAAQYRKTHIQQRGNYKVLGDVVSAGVPVAFHAWKPQPIDGAEPAMNRLEFAKWIMADDNPLTARVLANRYWETFFGVGIVRTSEEFGSQGDLPTNPELLDHLAGQLIRTGWDTKRFIRNIVLSAAYRQRSSVSPQRYEEDPENVYLSRGPRFRVTAEQIRDMALASAGLLSQKLYGPPTRPPQPSLGLTAAFGSKTDWDTSKGEDRFRRGLYTQWRRSNPYPSMATFDAPNREVCVLKRDRTNTPLQALVTLNDPAYVEAAQGLARRVAIHELPDATIEKRIERIFAHCLSRAPSPRETQALERLYHESFDELKKQPERAIKLATDPLGPLPAKADPIELAAWTTLCNVILNLDEFLMTP